MSKTLKIEAEDSRGEKATLEKKISALKYKCYRYITGALTASNVDSMAWSWLSLSLYMSSSLKYFFMLNPTLASALFASGVNLLYSVDIYSVFLNQETFLLWCLDL